MELASDQIFDVVSTLAAILHLGNASFVNAGGARIADFTGWWAHEQPRGAHLSHSPSPPFCPPLPLPSPAVAVELCAQFLGLEADQLADSLTQRVMVLRGEEITTPLSIEQANDSRDSLAMALYACLFKWVLERINARITGGEQFATVGILDIFGFENFEVC